MSKSLKNFITIDDALEKYTARQIRFAFLLQNWNARFDFKEDSMREVRSAEGILNVSSHFQHGTFCTRLTLTSLSPCRTSSLLSKLSLLKRMRTRLHRMGNIITKRPRLT